MDLKIETIHYGPNAGWVLTQGDNVIHIKPEQIVDYLIDIFIPSMPPDIYYNFMITAAGCHPESDRIAEQILQKFMGNFN